MLFRSVSQSRYGEAIVILDMNNKRIMEVVEDSAMSAWRDWILEVLESAIAVATIANYSKEGLRSVAIMLYLIMMMPISTQTVVVPEIMEKWGDLLKSFESVFVEIEKEGFQ